ncbi:MAG: AI-2E family transporter [Alistipes sp.]|nr:AI-2E family transporter [Alistipes sp.]
MNASTLTRWIVGLAIASVVVALLWYFRSVVVYILVSGVLAVVGRPVVRALSNLRIGRFYVPRWLAALLTLILMWVVIIAICSLVVPLVSSKIMGLSSLDLGSALSAIQEPLERAQEYFSSVLMLQQPHVSITEILISWLREVVDTNAINSAFSSVIDLGVSMVVVFFSISFITFFFMKEDGLFQAMITALFPERYKENVVRAMEKISVLLARYFTGLLVESIILMVVISVTLILFGMHTEDACFIGIIMGVMNVIPYAGPVIGAITSMFVGIVAPIDGCTISYTLTVIVCTILTVKGMDDFILQPTLYSERVNAHPLEVFIVILLAGSAGGILGMLLAIPCYTVMRVFAKEFFSQYTLVKKLTENV